MGVMIACIVAAAAVYVVFATRDDRRALRTAMQETSGVKGPARTQRVAIECLERFAKAPDEPGLVTSPYRRCGEADETDGTTRQRARAALRNARWLLLSAVDDAREVERLTRLRRVRAAQRRAMVQHRSESEAIQCVYEAERCLRRSILRRAPGRADDQRCYDAAPAILDAVTEFYEAAFPGDQAGVSSAEFPSHPPPWPMRRAG